MALRNLSRILQLLGLFVALAGLVGFWWPQQPERLTRTVLQEGLVNPAGEEFQASFVIAGRDYDATSFASGCRWVNGECIRDRTGTFRPSNRTDTILYVNIVGDRMSVVAIPRDLYLPQWQTRINAMLLYRQADGLREAVQDVLGVPVDYYVIVDVDIFESVVDALGGIEVNVPYRMYYRDSAAGLLIDLEPGPQRLDGEQTAGFVRFRNTPRGDIDRIDNVKLAVFAMLQRVRQLNVRAATAIPQLLAAYYEEVETNVSLPLLTRLLPRLGELELEAVATLPVTAEYRVEGVGAVVGYDPQEVEDFLAELHGGTARTFTTAPEVNVLISNRSGIEGMGEWLAERLVAVGVDPGSTLVQSGSTDPGPTRVLATEAGWADADWFTGLLDTGKQQVNRLAGPDGQPLTLEIVLGSDAPSLAGWTEQTQQAEPAASEAEFSDEELN